jgi:molybdopterin molybdotransferase
VRAAPTGDFDQPPRRLPAGDALTLLRARVRPVTGTETIPLAAATGRWLAEAITSTRDAPGFDNVAVDGYAFAHRSLGDGPTRLALLEGRAAAGHPHPGEVPAGAALRVLTGAPLPAGTDTAVMQEDARIEGDTVLVAAGLRPGANCRRQGEDLRRGQTVLEPGIRLRPQDIALAAVAGRGSVTVFCPLRVALLSTGDELADAGKPLGDGATPDVNRPMLQGLLEAQGCQAVDLGIVGDRVAALEERLGAAAAAHHVLITSGGASKGDEDHVIRTIARLGRLDLWQIAIKPGRPLAFGQIGACTTIGLPGNPVATFVCFVRFAQPVLAALGGGRWPEPQAFPVAAGFSMQKKAGRREYLRGVLATGEDGRLRAERVGREGSGIVTSLTAAGGLIEIAEEVTRIAPGDLVDFVPFSEFGIVG